MSRNLPIRSQLDPLMARRNGPDGQDPYRQFGEGGSWGLENQARSGPDAAPIGTLFTQQFGPICILDTMANPAPPPTFISRNEFRMKEWFQVNTRGFLLENIVVSVREGISGIASSFGLAAEVKIIGQLSGQRMLLKRGFVRQTLGPLRFSPDEEDLYDSIFVEAMPVFAGTTDTALINAPAPGKLTQGTNIDLTLMIRSKMGKTAQNV